MSRCVPPIPRLWLKYLVQRGWLTVYQMNQLLKAQADGLALGPYRIQDRLAHGAISQVFKAWDNRLDARAGLVDAMAGVCDQSRGGEFDAGELRR